VPAGRYILSIKLVVETTAAGVFRGRSAAVFSPKYPPGQWKIEAKELEDIDEQTVHGLTVTVRTSTPPAD
jgi:hypothetical protein